jgi:hypothetical protein
MYQHFTALCHQSASKVLLQQACLGHEPACTSLPANILIQQQCCSVPQHRCWT